ncbi:MAG: DUF4197 domain-containing protein [Ferruginibacter sp.]
MKKIVLSVFSVCLLTTVFAQGIGGGFKKLLGKDTTSKSSSILNKVLGGDGGKNLSGDEIVSGLKEALRVAADSSTKTLSQANGFFANQAIKILMPDEAKKAENTLRGMGMSSLVDKAILSMNRAAEDASGGVADIFWTSIKQMSVKDGLKILQGGDFAATEYLKSTTTAELTEKMRPVIEVSLNKVNATSYWKDVFTNYNRFSSNKVNPDLTAYVTGKALDGLFFQISLEEQKIRKDPAAQVTELLKKVFGK